MSVKFFIAPYNPAAWKNEADPSIKPTSDLQIDIPEYREQLIKRWSDVTLHSQPSKGCLLTWTLPLEVGQYTGLDGCLQENGQIIEFDTGPKKSFIDFILWHRATVPTRYPLYLFNSSSWDILKLTSDTTEQDIVNFTGIIS